MSEHVAVSPPEGGSPVLVKLELLAGLMEQGLNSTQAEQHVSEFEKAVNFAISESKQSKIPLDEPDMRRLGIQLTVGRENEKTQEQAEKFVRSLSKALTNPSANSEDEEEEDEEEEDSALAEREEDDILTPLLNQKREGQVQVNALSAVGFKSLKYFQFLIHLEKKM